MTLKWIGAVLIIAGCSGVGFSIAAAYRKTESALLQVITAAEFMACELQYRLTPLPELCTLTAEHTSGPTSAVFRKLSELLNDRQIPDAVGCMAESVMAVPSLPERAKANLLHLGQTLGRFDLQGQLSGLASVRELTQRDLDGMQVDKELRLRSYQTLGICAGVALVILFI